MIIKSFQLESIETNCTRISTRERRKSERRFLLSNRHTTKNKECPNRPNRSTRSNPHHLGTLPSNKLNTLSKKSTSDSRRNGNNRNTCSNSTNNSKCNSNSTCSSSSKGSNKKATVGKEAGNEDRLSTKTLSLIC